MTVVTMEIRADDVDDDGINDMKFEFAIDVVCEFSGSRGQVFSYCSHKTCA